MTYLTDDQIRAAVRAAHMRDRRRYRLTKRGQRALAALTIIAFFAAYGFCGWLEFQP